MSANSAAREDMRGLLDELRGRPGLNDLDDEQSMALAVSEARTVRRGRAVRSRGRAGGRSSGSAGSHRRQRPGLGGPHAEWALRTVA